MKKKRMVRKRAASVSFAGPTRRLTALIREVETLVLRNRHDLDLQFQRLAQLQAEVDDIKGLLRKGPRATDGLPD